MTIKHIIPIDAKSLLLERCEKEAMKRKTSLGYFIKWCVEEFFRQEDLHKGRLEDD